MDTLVTEPTNRYYVFGYNNFYPKGGMSDCIHKTNDVSVAIYLAVIERDNYLYTHVWDTAQEKHLSLPEETDV